jgi:hypothetical protein
MNRQLTFRLSAYVGGTLISALGDQMALVGVAWAVLHLTGSYVAMGSVFGSEVVARLLFSLIGGGLADLVHHRRFMMIINGLRIVVVGLVALALWNNLDSIPLLMGLAGGLGVLDSLYIPTSQAFLPIAVPAEHLMVANSWLEVGNQLAMFVGPAIGGLVIAWKGLVWPFALDAISYAAAILGLLPWLGVALESGERPTLRLGSLVAQVGQQLKIGLRTVQGSPFLRWSVLIAGLLNFAAVGPLTLLLPKLSLNLGHTPTLFGALYAMLGIGALGGALLSQALQRISHRAVWGFAGFTIDGCLLGALGIAHTWVFAAILIGLFGAFMSVSNILILTTLQIVTPIETLGSVFGFLTTSSFGFQAIALVGAAQLVRYVGPSHLFEMGGGILALTAGVVMLLPFLKTVESVMGEEVREVVPKMVQGSLDE